MFINDEMDKSILVCILPYICKYIYRLEYYVIVSIIMKEYC